MITEQDLQEAISECLGQRNPNASTCIKLAAFYTIRNEMYGNSERSEAHPLPMYSMASPPDRQAEIYVDYISDTEFGQAVHGMDAQRAWEIVDELADAVRVVNPRLHTGLIKKIEEG